MFVVRDKYFTGCEAYKPPTKLVVMPSIADEEPSAGLYSALGKPIILVAISKSSNDQFFVVEL